MSEPTDRSPPHSAEAEEQVIACCLLDGDNADEHKHLTWPSLNRCLQQGLVPDSFYSPANRLIYTILIDLRNSGRPATLEVLAEELKTRRQFEAVGGFPYLMQVTGKIPTTAHAGYMIDKVREKATRRELIRSATGLVEQAYNGVELPDLLEHAKELLEPTVRANPNSLWPDIVPADSLCAKPPATPEILIEGMLYRGGTMLLSGPSKAHKTFTMLDMACAVAEGRPWLGFKTIKTPVLYVNLELQNFAVAKRVDQICKALNTKPSSNLHLWNLRGHSVTLFKITALLPKMIKAIGAGLVVIDPHYKISSVSSMEENSNDDQGRLLSALEALCGLNGASLVICHHFAKGDSSVKNAIDRASGGGVFARWGDVMLTFTPHEEEAAMSVEMALRNFAPVEPFVVRWNHPRWSLDDELDPSKLKTRGGGPKEKYSAADTLKKLGSGLMSYTEWLNASGLKEATFRRKRDVLIDENKVKVVNGFYQIV